MFDYQFQFDTNPKMMQSKGSQLEFWVPLQQDPFLHPQEKNALLYGDIIESLHVVKPAFLYTDSQKRIDFSPADQFEYYYTIAKLKKSPYLVLIGEEKKSSVMQEHLEKNHRADNKNCFYLDLYFGPTFGGVRPKYFLFERTDLKSVPNTMVLFRGF